MFSSWFHSGTSFRKITSLCWSTWLKTCWNSSVASCTTMTSGIWFASGLKVIFLSRSRQVVSTGIGCALLEKNASSGAGVCWLCMGGNDAGGPWEDFNVNARWSTVQPQEPWASRPTLLRLFHNVSEPEAFFRPDIWHCYHGGAGKLFVASALAEALALFDGSMDNRVEQMAEALRTWAKKPGNQLPHSGQFCKERIQLTSYQVLPDASWSKFNDTYVYHRFLEWLLMENLEQVSDNETLKTILDATRCINRSFKILYQSGLFLTSAEALEAGQLGRAFLRL